MTDFNQQQSDLDKYLEEQFATPAQSAQVEEPPVEDDITDYIVEDTDETQPAQQVAPQAPVRPQQQALPEDRVLALERELAAERARAQMYQNAIAAQIPQAPQEQPKVPSGVYNDDEVTVDQRYVDMYGDANPLITAIARQVYNEAYQRSILPLQQELQQVKGAIGQQYQVSQQQQQENLYMGLKTAIPDIDDLVRTPEWQSYIQQPDAYGGTRTIAHYVQEGIQSKNIHQIKAIVDSFKQAQQQANPNRQQVAPGRAPQTQPNTATGRGKKMLNQSGFDRATQDFQNGRIDYTKYQQIVDVYNQAAIEGRVNYNK